jgi:hypothetical protein
MESDGEDSADAPSKNNDDAAEVDAGNDGGDDEMLLGDSDTGDAPRQPRQCPQGRARA